MNTGQTLILVSGGLLLFAAAAAGRANIEAADGDITGMVSVDALTDTVEAFYNVVTEEAAQVDMDTSQTNINAFLRVIQQCEGTDKASDPYRVCFGYRHTIQSLHDHPAKTGEWAGETLPPTMCANAGFGPGCKSTAAGAYQMIKPTWSSLQKKLGLPDFGPESQDAAAVELIRARGALEDVKAGRIDEAVYKVRSVWASLPGNYAKQGQRSIQQIAGWFESNGGTLYA